VSVMVGEAVGVGVKVEVGVTVGVAEAVQVGDGRLVAVGFGVKVKVARVAEGLAVGFCLVAVLQPAINTHTVNRKILHRVCRWVIVLHIPINRQIANIKYFAYVTVKKE
jgi:hypothetical protein